MPIIEIHPSKLINVQVRGQLELAPDLDDLDQDILEVELENGLVIDVGWIPENDPTGAYRIVVYHQYWDNQITDPVFTKYPTEVAEIVDWLIRDYSATLLPQHRSSFQSHDNGSSLT